MTNDVLEQVVEDYFRSQGYFTQHNIKYRPETKEQKHAVHSDIDILAYHPLKKANVRTKVAVASCKSWQGGLNITRDLKILQETPNRKLAGKECWKLYREIMDKNWAQAIKAKVKRLTGVDSFTFYFMVTKFQGNRDAWENSKLFCDNLTDCDIKIMNMEEMLIPLQNALTITPTHSELSRMLQLIKAGGGAVAYKTK